MALTVLYPKIEVNTTITGIASESTLQAVLDEISKNVVYSPFFEAVNTLTNVYANILTVGANSVEEISLKQNDGNIISIAVDGVEKLVCPPSGEVQKYPLKAVTGQVISIKAIGTVSNAGPIEINFFG